MLLDNRTGSLGSRIVKVLRFVKDNPGVSSFEINSEFGVNCNIYRYVNRGILDRLDTKYFISEKGLNLLSLADREDAVLEYVKIHPGCTTKDIRRAFLCPPNFIYDLKAKNRVVSITNRKQSYWFTADYEGEVLIPTTKKKISIKPIVKTKPKIKPIEVKPKIVVVRQPEPKELWEEQCILFDKLVHPVISRRLQ